MKHKTRLLPLVSLLLAGGILCTGCGGAAPAESPVWGGAAPASGAPAAVSTASPVEEVSAMDGYDYLNDYIGLWGYYNIDLWLRVHEDSTFEFVNSEDEAIYTGTADADEYGMDLYFDDDTPQMRLGLSLNGGPDLPAGSFRQRRPAGGGVFGCAAPGGCHRLPGDLL